MKCLISILILILTTSVNSFADPMFSEPAKDDHFTSCKYGKKCILVQAGCCNCPMGGKQVAINKIHKKAWEQEIHNNCKDTLCAAFMSNDSSCLPDVKAVCENDTCIIKHEPVDNKDKTLKMEPKTR